MAGRDIRARPTGAIDFAGSAIGFACKRPVFRRVDQPGHGGGPLVRDAMRAGALQVGARIIGMTGDQRRRLAHELGRLDVRPGDVQGASRSRDAYDQDGEPVVPAQAAAHRAGTCRGTRDVCKQNPLPVLRDRLHRSGGLGYPFPS
jgi:hypothetical protein